MTHSEKLDIISESSESDMTLNLELDKDEVKTAVQSYLAEQGYDVDVEDIGFRVRSGSSSRDPRTPSSPHLVSCECENAEPND